MPPSVPCRLAAAIVPLVLAAGPLAAQTTTITVSRSLVTFTDSLGPASATRTFALGVGSGFLASGPLAYRLLAFDPLPTLPLAGEGLGLAVVGIRLFDVAPSDSSLVFEPTPIRPPVFGRDGVARLGGSGEQSFDRDNAATLDRLATAASYGIGWR